VARDDGYRCRMPVRSDCHARSLSPQVA
jgi:hypothetical protein